MFFSQDPKTTHLQTTSLFLVRIKSTLLVLAVTSISFTLWETHSMASQEWDKHSAFRKWGLLGRRQQLKGSIITTIWALVSLLPETKRTHTWFFYLARQTVVFTQNGILLALYSSSLILITYGLLQRTPSSMREREKEWLERMLPLKLLPGGLGLARLEEWAMCVKQLSNTRHPPLWWNSGRSDTVMMEG